MSAGLVKVIHGARCENPDTCVRGSTPLDWRIADAVRAHLRDLAADEDTQVLVARAVAPGAFWDFDAGRAHPDAAKAIETTRAALTACLNHLDRDEQS